MPKLLIVDDSALMRKFLRETFEAVGGFEIQTARNGADALKALQTFDCDVITLDINMPEMDGLTCLSHIMVEFPRPVVMVSSITAKDSIPTLEALALGAVDYIEKPGGTISLNMAQIQDALVRKVLAASRARIRRAHNLTARIEALKKARTAIPPKKPVPPLRTGEIRGLLLIGASTGGPRTVEDILPLLPEDYPYPVLLSLHMPGTFTGHFVKRLDNMCKLRVVEVTQTTPIAPGFIYVAQGDTDMLVSRKIKGILVAPGAMDTERPWHPSVDRMVETAMEAIDPSLLTCVLLTGMGFDGAEAMATVLKKGGHTIAESEESCVVFGMPKELIERGGAEIVLDSDKMMAQLLKWLPK